MSQTNKKQNSQKKRDDSVRSKPENPLTPTGQRKKSAATKETLPSKPVADKTKSVMPDEVDRIFAVQNQQEFLIENYLNQTKQSRQNNESNSYKKILQTAIAKLQAEIKQRERGLSNLPFIRNNYEEAVADAEEKIHMCGSFENYLKEDYASMLVFMTEKMKTIVENHAETNAIIARTNAQQKHFDREFHMGEEKLQSVRSEIVSISTERDTALIQINNSNKIISDMTKVLAKLSKSNERLTEQIHHKRNEVEVNNESLTNLKDNMQFWIDEKSVALQKMKEEEFELKNLQTNLLATLAETKDKYKDLDDECNELTKKTAEQKIAIDRVKTANKTLSNREALKMQLEEDHSFLTDELDKIKNEIAGIEMELDEKQQKNDDLKRIREEILKKQQNRDDLQSNFAALKIQNANVLGQVTNSRKEIEKMKSSEDQKGQVAINLAKRIRLSLSTSTEERLDAEVDSDASSIHLEDYGIDCEFDNDFDSFSSKDMQN